MTLILHFSPPNWLALLANYIIVVEDRPTISVYCIQIPVWAGYLSLLSCIKYFMHIVLYHIILALDSNPCPKFWLVHDHLFVRESCVCVCYMSVTDGPCAHQHSCWPENRFTILITHILLIAFYQVPLNCLLHIINTAALCISNVDQHCKYGKYSCTNNTHGTYQHNNYMQANGIEQMQRAPQPMLTSQMQIFASQSVQ